MHLPRRSMDSAELAQEVHLVQAWAHWLAPTGLLLHLRSRQVLGRAGLHWCQLARGGQEGQQPCGASSMWPLLRRVSVPWAAKNMPGAACVQADIELCQLLDVPLQQMPERVERQRTPECGVVC